MPSPSSSGSKPAKPEKNMSSRLLTMKFMQRAAASAATKEAAQSASGSELSDSTPKKRRVSAADGISPAPSSDLEAISAALAEEEERRREAISRQAAEAGETEWVLDFGDAVTVDQPAQPLVLADSSLDADDDDLGYGGRQLYGNFKRKTKAKPPTEEAEDGGDSPKPRQTEKQKRVNIDTITSISGGRSKQPGGNNEKSQKKRKHK
ncbi:hypothetical protein AN8048.2 [Aspergillus nidulans FGSC A4]|uniref:Uncharacterized protein n=1 Tax=Emericella nidulans (strain FGSC A4 / ATCC 38163 / CBS 112.46 / NRRL 194 / M139) TaxID=227321 RepID=Q5AUI2_EMENI|nr:hypothetical protein [Aspergillus nidulans FGSC A4]EAA59670.1 hypothetical protein AN8048.2 [Aspergillus nidulans FGSC A4]CBF73777.1 TPA: hypothetical protein ANIA_08048 [Aspergillus nidulans FGSC A4]|eukprot:XP_681317.1 hypothetical protein AN8048.2 [Aspergillus nidulans FGSC A4]